MRIISIAIYMLVAAVAHAGGGGAFRLIMADAEGWTYEYTGGRHIQTTIIIGGEPHILFEGEGGREGEPHLPVDALVLGIPFNALVNVEVINPVYELSVNQLIAPNPSYSFDEERNAIPEYRKDAAVYARNGWYPERQFYVDQPVTIRQQRVAVVRLRPFQYNAATGTLRRITGATLRIRLINGAGSLPGVVAATPDPQFEQVYASMLHNYEQAKQWRGLEAQVSDGGPDPTRDWFETGRTYYRIRIAHDGWYKVTKADLAAAGANVSMIEVPSLRVYGRGLQVPLIVRPDTTIEFYAVRNYGDSTYIDFFTDTSSYFLTWGGTAGTRYTAIPQPGGVPGVEVWSAAVTRHFEQNNYYYVGTGEAEEINIHTNPGEGWTWGTFGEWFFPGTVRTYAFSLDTIDFPGGPLAGIRVRLFSTTADSPWVDHQATVWVNDSLVAQLSFEGRSEGFLNATFPTDWLLNGENILKISSGFTPTIPNQFYLDWFEIDYRRFLRARNDQIVFVSPVSSGSNPARFHVMGFTSPDIEVRDTTGRRIITGGSVNLEADGKYSITFADTFSSARTYVVTASPGALPVLPLLAKTFTDIRVNPGGADYVVITHRNFLASALQLAAHRQVNNSVRTKVIDVQDIYDEFNYGVFNATKLKTFLQFAYENWAAPAPTYLLLFGDASWDYHGYLPTTVKVNYVPTYGRPSSDNWFACFNPHPDSTFLPSLVVGRLPVQDSIEAARVVNKVIGYDSYTPGEWNKNFMMVTGGDSPSQQQQFNSLSDGIINSFILPSPIGGTAFRVYKTTPFVHDGENKQIMRDHVKGGVTFINYLGHSGGRIWSVDIGPPGTLENTDGKLPFVSSVSCNVGAFSEPSSNVLSEDFVLADNRGGIGAWASSSVGYATLGNSLVRHFLTPVRDETLRGFGTLTTLARYRFWLERGSGFRNVAMVNLNPLLGDPLSRMAIPVQPDLAILEEGISLNTSSPSVLDSVFTVKLKFHNYGLVPTDSVGLRVTDLYNGNTGVLLDNWKLAPTRHRDSITFNWDAAHQYGRHTLVVTLDPLNAIAEINELNNTMSSEQYVYPNLLAVVRPLDNMVVLPGSHTLVVTSPVGRDTVGFHYEFELDTVTTFDSPALVRSGPVLPGPVSGEWTTPSLTDGRVYFWRARTVEGTVVGSWVTSCVSVSPVVPSLPEIRLRQYTRKQFERNTLVRTEAGDSGVGIVRNLPVQLYSRSTGARYNPNLDYYSVLRVNAETISGLPWVLGIGFMTIRINDLTGAFDFRMFNVPSNLNHADSMRAFINNTPAGNYLMFSVLFNGSSAFTESVFVALESLGSTMIRQIQQGDSWAMIARKGIGGPGMTPMESLSTTGEAAVSFEVPIFYSALNGYAIQQSLPVATSWDSLTWMAYADSGITSIRTALLGVRTDGRMDTLRIIPSDSLHVSLSSLQTLTSGPTYTSLKAMTLLVTKDAARTPRLSEWSVDFAASLDLAISARTVGTVDLTIEKGTVLDLPVTVHNLGFQGADSARIMVSVYDKYNKARQIAWAQIDTIPVGGSKSTTIPISTTNFSRRVTLQVAVSPSKKSKDLVPDNNTAYYTFLVTGTGPSGITVSADGIQLMDGDYVSATPTLLVRLPEFEGTRRADLFVDNRLLSSTGALAKTGTTAADELLATPELTEGRHEFRVEVVQVNSLGVLDSISHTVGVTVLAEARIMNVYNYPNPFRDETQFTFHLTGTQPPDEVAIRVFTIAGRKIREIILPAGSMRVGFNKVVWDGRDSDGDEVANGYYFYQITLKSRGKSASTIEKLAKIR